MAPKTAPEVVNKVLAFLDIGWTLYQIINHFKGQQIKINKMTISRIKKRKENPIEIKKKVQKKGNRSVLTDRQISELKNMVSNPNPPTLQSMAKKFGVTKQAISWRIKDTLGKKLVKKPKGQALSKSVIEKRYRRSWPLYRRLSGQQWTKVITSDEAWIYLTNKDRKTQVQYISRTENKSVCETFKKESHPKGVMVWVAISAKGCSKVRFIVPGAKINTNYYIIKVLKPFIKEDIPRLYPNGDYIFHQDSAPSHRSKKTQKFPKDNGMQFISQEEWMPNSPDAAPYFFFWDYLKHLIN